MKPQLTNTERIDILLTKSSFFGLLSLYACKISSEKKKAFNKEDIFKGIYEPAYFWGYIVACASFELLTYNIAQGIVTILEFDQDLLLKIEKTVRDKAKLTPTWQPYVDQIEKYFESSFATKQ